jgi:hypothetical protein
MAWYLKAADQGMATAQHYLGVMFANGRGVQRDFEVAAKWYRKAADRGYPVSQHNLGVMYANGQGVSQNDAEAVRWYRRAAEHSYSCAWLNLGFMYGTGRGVPQNYVQAYMWYNLAAPGLSEKQDRDRAINSRDSLAASMTSSQIAEAQAMSERCLQSDYKNCGFQSPQVARRDDSAPPSPAAKNKVTSTGTGFFASEKGHLITNANVVDGCQTVRASRGGTLRMISTDVESSPRTVGLPQGYKLERQNHLVPPSKSGVIMR